MKLVFVILAICFGLLLILRNRSVAYRLRVAERGRGAGSEAEVPMWMRVYVGIAGLAFMVAAVGYFLQ